MRYESKVTKFAEGLKSFEEVLKSKKANIRDLAYDNELTIEWDFSDDSIKYQVARLTARDKDGHEIKLAISVQELQHYLRAI